MNMALEVPDPKEVTVGQYRELTKLEVNEDLKIRPKRIHFFEDTFVVSSSKKLPNCYHSMKKPRASRRREVSDPTLRAVVPRAITPAQGV